MRRVHALRLAVATLALAASCAGPSPGDDRPDTTGSSLGARPAQLPGTPPPTEHRLADDAEGDNKSRRKAWFRELHRTPPDVDYREVERANGLAQLEKRNGLAAYASTASPWVERGSRNQAGRIHAAVPATDGAQLYAGSAKGGIFRGALDGTGWVAMGDNLYGGAHWLAVTPSPSAGAPDVVLAATDWGNIHVTHDDGASWVVPTGLANTNVVRRVLTTSDGSYVVFVLARSGSTYRLFRSTDGMTSFTSVRNLAGYPGDVWMPRTGSNDLYLLQSGTIHRSTDLGDSWTSVGSLPVGTSNGELCGSEAGAPRLWAAVESAGADRLYRSDDAGASWSFVRDLTDYWNVVEASITDVDRFAWGGVEVHRTTNGGGSFSVVNTWGSYYGNPATKLHADIMGMSVVSTGPSSERWYVCTDGGVYDSANSLGTVRNLSLDGLTVSQYYSTHTSALDPERIHAGAQDQGYQVSSGPATAGTLQDFDQIISGDYGHLTSGDGTHAYVFSTYPGFAMAAVGELGSSLHTMDFPEGEDHAWIPPVVADPDDRRDFFWCGNHIWRYDKGGGNSWSASLWSTHDFELSGGEYVSALAFSPLDAQRAWAATNRGRLWWSIDKGRTWTQASGSAPDDQYLYGNALLPSALDVDTVYVGGSGYGPAPVKRSTDGGLTWQDWDTGLPDTLVYDLCESPDGSGAVYAATETAAYRRDLTGAGWVDITGNQAPVTTYWTVEAVDATDVVRFGTYGRGIWDYRVQPPSPWSAETLTCTNVAGSFSILDGAPIVGSSMVLGVDNPLGTQGAFSVPVVLLSIQPSPGSPCGTPIPGWGMAGGGLPGELLVDLGPPVLPTLIGQSLWLQPGTPAPVNLTIPANANWVGQTLYAQGVLVDTIAAQGVGIALAEAIEMTIGN